MRFIVAPFRFVRALLLIAVLLFLNLRCIWLEHRIDWNLTRAERLRRRLFRTEDLAYDIEARLSQ